MRKLNRSYAIAVALLVASAGCANLTAIRDFAKVSSDAASYHHLVDDYVAAPARRARYAPKGKPCLECAQASAERERQRAALLLEQEALQEYMDALGELAADDLVDFSKEYADLGTAASKASFVTANEGQAVGTIAALLTKAATDAWRQRQLKNIIAAANPPIQVVIAGLQKIMTGFGIEVSNEEDAAQSYYRTLAMESRDRAGVAALEEWRLLRTREIADRAVAVETYRRVLSTIAAGHQKLFDNRNDLATKDTLDQIKAYAGDLKKAYKALQELKG